MNERFNGRFQERFLQPQAFKCSMLRRWRKQIQQLPKTSRSQSRRWFIWAIKSELKDAQSLVSVARSTNGSPASKLYLCVVMRNFWLQNRRQKEE